MDVLSGCPQWDFETGFTHVQGNLYLSNYITCKEVPWDVCLDVCIVSVTKYTEKYDRLSYD